MTTGSDQSIFIGCCTGDKADQEVFIRRFSNLVYSTALRTYKAKGCECSNQDLDDLHNTVFMRLLERRCKRLRQFKGKNGCSLASWIRVITVRTVIDHLRQSRDALSHPSKLDSDETLTRLQADVPEPWKRLDTLEQKRMLYKAMESLRPRDRLILKLHCLKEVSIREVAGILKVSENNAYSLKHRAIQRLKTTIEREWGKN